MSFSMGLTTRCSTSRGEAPGMGRMTSTMGTRIWGSSSRGVMMTAKTPRIREVMMKRRVSLLLMK
ncbi:MAG: hypothetical protein B7Z74_11320 [Deltaproteobacteria bacterium 21-66-5]|nr:MAG: hypothetical protein B7Z74_11320 [Deltaproteobacteria bacterium 21-66-5]